MFSIYGDPKDKIQSFDCHSWILKYIWDQIWSQTYDFNNLLKILSGYHILFQGHGKTALLVKKAKFLDKFNKKFEF